jgi:hypothetical protein
MTLWLTLLLVWTTGIPAALFASATLAARLGERRVRVSELVMPRDPHTPGAICGRRTHSSGRLSSRGARPVRMHVGGRRRV